MTQLDNIQRDLKAVQQDLKAIQEVIKPTLSAAWVSEKEAAKVAGMHINTLRRLRKAGKVGKWRIPESGRGIQYLRSDIDKLFITSK